MTFDEFVAASQVSLLRTAAALTGDVDSAQDLVQAALARCWLKWARVSSADNPLAYTKRILYTVFISEKRRRRPEVILESLPEVPAPIVAAFDEDLFKAIRALPPRQRAVIVARYLDDLSEAEAAHQLKRSVGTIKSQTFKALRALQDSPWLADTRNATLPNGTGA